MKTEELFEGFDDATQREYEREAAQRWGEARVRDSRRRWDAYGPDKQAEIMAEGQANAAALAPYIGQDPALPAVQALGPAGMSTCAISTNLTWAPCAAWGRCTRRTSALARTMKRSRRGWRRFSARRLRRMWRGGGSKAPRQRS